MRAALDARNYSVPGVANEMGLDAATLRRYLSDTYPGTLPVDQLLNWFEVTGGDLSPIRQQVHLCGFELHPILPSADVPQDTPGQTANLSRGAGELVAKLIDQWADGRRTLAERRESLPMLCDLRAALDRIIAADEAALAEVR